MSPRLPTPRRIKKRHATLNEKKQVIAWQARTRKTMQETVDHFRFLWKGEIRISLRSFRRWRGKEYAGVLCSAPTVATTITGASDLESSRRRPSIFEEEDVPPPHVQPAAVLRRVPRASKSIAKRRARRLPVPCRAAVKLGSTRSQRFVPPPTHAAVEASKNESKNAYWWMYRYHQQCAKALEAEGKSMPRLDPAIAGILYDKFKIIV